MSAENHTILVAVEVYAPDRDAAHELVMAGVATAFEQWWIAEDDRQDGSDNDSAVFCNPGAQVEASGLLYAENLTGRCNVVPFRETTV